MFLYLYSLDNWVKCHFCNTNVNIESSNMSLSCLENGRTNGEYMCNECVCDLFPLKHIVDNKQFQYACQNYYTQSNASPNNTIIHEVVNNFENKCITLIDDELCDQNILSNQYFTVKTFNENLGSFRKHNIIYLNCRSLSKFFENLDLFLNDLEHQTSIWYHRTFRDLVNWLISFINVPLTRL